MLFWMGQDPIRGVIKRKRKWQVRSGRAGLVGLIEGEWMDDGWDAIQHWAGKCRSRC